ncbi:MAG: hypothetical protein Q9190_006705 [Brigantiaea leucoxantha]
MAEQPEQAQSIHARIAALNLGHVGRAPITAYSSEHEAQERPQLATRSQSVNVPTDIGNSQASNGIGNEPNGVHRNGVLPPPNVTRTGQKVTPSAANKPIPPPRLPPRKQSTGSSPALPPRRPSEYVSRRGSNESISSTISSVSAVSTGTNGTARTVGSRTPSMDAGRKMAPVFDLAALPPLPPKRTPDQVEKRYQDIERSRMGLKPSKSTTSVAKVETTNSPAMPSRPRPPQTPARTDSTDVSKKLPLAQPPPVSQRSALSFGMNKSPESVETNEVKPRTPSPASKPSAPPPIPLSSRPDLSKLQATKPRPGAASSPNPPTSAASCLVCRDFSAPDAHAAKFPRETVPSLDWLAAQLTSPFPSLTDQARAIFTWLHHNIAYDIIAFCNSAVQPSSPANTLSTGLAVCQGYAGLFTALASKAGLESLVINGHGKGAGFSPLKAGDPIPAEYSTHAWNVVKIDKGEWKLIDTCWGAGYVDIGKQTYTKRFAPRFFTMDNNTFGLRHFPTNKSLFYRTDAPPPSWEEYILGPHAGQQSVTVYEGLAEAEGIHPSKILPPTRHIPLSGSNTTLRFQFEKPCPHWDSARHGSGPPYPYILIIGGIDGRAKENIAFHTNGTFWWADVEVRKLGCKGQKVGLYAVETVGGKSARGMSREEFEQAKGRQAMHFGGVAGWELV